MKRLPFSFLLIMSTAVICAQPPAPSQLDYYERYIAIDETCAWPNLSLLPNGSIAAIIWPFTNHGVTEGAAECWLSDDAGVSWELASVPVPNTPTTNRMNVAVGVVDEKLLTLVGGWDRRRPFEGGKGMGPDKREGAVTIQPLAAVSADHGKSWKQFPDLKLPFRENGKSLVPYGDIHKLATGEYGVFLYGDGVFFYTSHDEGITWQRCGTITDESTHNETTWVQLDNGDLYAAARTYGDIRLDGYRSTDDGRTWEKEGALTGARQHPADLLKLSDGRVLLSYASRNAGMYGIWVQMGDPELRNWSQPMLLVDLEGSTEFYRTPAPSSDGGYPSTVQTADGTFVTAYYSRGVPAHQRYHMGIVRWKLAKNGLPILSTSAR